MYGIALSVAACLRAGTAVDVAWTVETTGFSSRDKSEALAITPGGGRIGSLLSGSLNEQLAELSARGGAGRIVNLHVEEFEATLAGLSCGGDARCVLVPATALPAWLWERLQDREPVCLVTRLDGDRVTSVEAYTRDDIAGAGEEAARLFGRGTSDTLVAAAGLLGWNTETTTETGTATGLVAGLSILDKLVVLSHDLEVAGPTLAAALDGGVGYIGALGSRRTQESRAEWLAYRDITDLGRIHGPAGLDIGASTPAEIAVSIVAEALAVAKATSARPLRDQSTPIH